MKTNRIRQKLLKGEPTLGCYLGLGSPNVVELMAAAGFEWLVFEAEHSALEIPDIERMLMAVGDSDTVPLVRIPSNDPVWIQRALDIGGMGIIVPMVQTAVEAEAIVRATRYPPVGIRGFGPLRAAKYSFDFADYFARANENIIIGLILETKEAVNNLEEIASIPGIDAIHLGPFDLCLSYGLDPMKQPHREVEQAIEKMLSVGKKTGTAMGIHVSTPEELKQRLDEGFTMISYGTDYSLLVRSAKAGIEAFGMRNRSEKNA